MYVKFPLLSFLKKSNPCQQMRASMRHGSSQVLGLSLIEDREGEAEFEGAGESQNNNGLTHLLCFLVIFFKIAVWFCFSAEALAFKGFIIRAKCN